MMTDGDHETDPKAKVPAWTTRRLVDWPRVFPSEKPASESRWLFILLSAVTVASALQSRRLNYLESLELVKDNWSLPIHGDPKTQDATVGCEEFITWLQDNKQTIRKYRDTIEPSEKTNEQLKELGL